MTQSEKVKKIAKLLRRKLPILTNMEAVHIAYLILETLEKTDKVEVRPNE